LSKKRSLHQVSEHFETIFNAAMAEKMLRAKLSVNVMSSRPEGEIQYSGLQDLSLWSR